MVGVFGLNYVPSDLLGLPESIESENDLQDLGGREVKVKENPVLAVVMQVQTNILKTGDFSRDKFRGFIND